MPKTYDAPEWLRSLRGYPAYLLCARTPVIYVWPRLWHLLLPYAGDWVYRHERRALRTEGQDHA